MATRIGHLWTKQEEDSILADIQAGLRIGDIAVKQQRTTGGIRSRLTRIACSFVEEKKMSLYEASGRTGIRAARIQEVLKRKTEEEKVKKECLIKMQFNFTTTTSREELAGLQLKNKIRYLMQVAESIHGGVYAAAGSGRTNYLWETDDSKLNPPHDTQRIRVTVDEVMSALRARYPGCAVEKVEEWVEQPSRHGQPPTRVLKSGIKIDWS